MKAVEDNYRLLYAKEPAHFQLNPPYLNLVSVFDHLKTFRYALESPEEGEKREDWIRLACLLFCYLHVLFVLFFQAFVYYAVLSKVLFWPILVLRF
jgi:hypothetical protein